MFPESLEFKKRNRRPPEDPVNAMLSLCYTLLHYEMVREIEVIGLDPTIGFYHQFDYGRESLACDIVEMYRTDVDTFVWEIFRERIFAVRDFAHEDERPGCYLKKESRKRFYPLYEEWAKGIRPQLVNEVRTLAVRIVDGQDIISE
jgi:CRISPR-associated protein Cas1